MFLEMEVSWLEAGSALPFPKEAFRQHPEAVCVWVQLFHTGIILLTENFPGQVSSKG